jgi:hypothetical protein
MSVWFEAARLAMSFLSEAVAVAKFAKASAVSDTNESMALFALWKPLVWVVACDRRKSR